MQNKPPPCGLFAETPSPLPNSSINVTLPEILICPICVVQCLFLHPINIHQAVVFISDTGFEFEDMNYQVFPYIAYSLVGVMAEKKSIHRLMAIIGSAEKKLAFGVVITPHW